MDLSIHDALLQHGWKREWFNETETIARADSRSGIPCFVPFSRKHRFFHWHRYISIRNFLGAKGTRIKFSSALDLNYHYFGVTDEEKGEMWKMRIITLTWIREVFVRFPHDAT